jgi:tetratricopeptide (TPR) repeat protein
MRNLNKIFLAMTALALAACASSPAQKEDADRKARSQVFFEGLQSQRATDSAGSCHQVSANAKASVTAQSWKTLISEASACVKAENWQAVDGWAFELSRSQADSPWGLYYFSVAAEGQHDYARATWMIEAAIKKSGHDVAIFRYQKARILWTIKPSESALKEAQAALDLDPALIDAHNFLGDARFRTEDFKAAAQHYESALKISATDVHALKGLQAIQIQTGKAPERAVASPMAAAPADAKKGATK